MPSTKRIAIDDHLGAELPAAMPDEVRRSLTDTPKRLPSKYFYDEEGSRLFEQITELPEYYPTRLELGIILSSTFVLSSWEGRTKGADRQQG